MDEASQTARKQRRPLWPWVVAAAVLCLFAAGFSFWRPMYRTNELISAIRSNRGVVNHTEPSSAWKMVFGDRIHPWFHDVIDVHAFPEPLSPPQPLKNEQVLELAHFRGLRSLVLDVSQASDEAIGELNACDALLYLQLIGDDRPIPLEWVPELPKLKHLRLTRVRVTADSWRALAQLKGPSVSMIDCTTEGAPHLSGSLTMLTFDHVDLTEDAGKTLHDLPLRFLTVRECDSSPEFWQALAGHPRLKILGIVSTEVSELGMEGISELAALQELVLIQHVPSSMILDRRRVQLIGNLQALQTLRLDRVEVPDDDSWRAVAQLPELRSLELKKCPIGDTAAAELARSPSLEGFIVEDTNVTGTGIMKLVKLTTLKRVYFSGSKISASSKAEFAKARPDVVLEY